MVGVTVSPGITYCNAMIFAGFINTFCFRLPAVAAVMLLAATSLGQRYLAIPWPGLALMVGCCVATWLVVSQWEARQRAARDAAAKRYIDALCACDPHELSNPQTVESLPLLGASHPWHSTLTRVGERLVEYGRRADEAEHAHTSSEVRSRRLE